ncbi:adenosine deaminase [Paenibacillus sp. NEAU-GSW1]|uniref:adenosine deaminase n=1 Tax=Paenibacillus sp. NEAU-GSW1 TaxID=2682486 RepID=UPI0012E1010F|nr:adenosine deaminase [Paenibacillus sp. NEAU-GSW1]MUT67075.1 adenosine deaminase [Paenibacillus sp. NEAU-GSW1]
MEEKLMERLKRLPKVDLHLHLDGSVKPSAVQELAERQGKKLPITDGGDLTPWMQIDSGCTDLRHYLSKFDFVLPFLQTGDALEQVAFDTVQQADEQNCLYIEVRYAPLLHTVGGLELEEIINHVNNGLARGERTFGVLARSILICMRHDSYERNAAVIEAASRYYGNGVVAVDLAGDEAGFPPHLHRPLFNLAKRHELPITIHAGEAGGAQNVIEAIKELGANRIGHGIRIDGEQEAIELVRRTGTPLELCPVSNIQTKAAADWESYPIKSFLEQGIAVTVNTDNLTVSDTSITLEYAMLYERCGLSMEELGKLIRNGAAAAFLEQPLKARLIERVERLLEHEGL